MATAECSSCHAGIHWCEKDPLELNDRGLPKMVPVDAGTVGQEGKLEVWSVLVMPNPNGADAYALKFRYLKKGEVPAEGHSYATSHFATCPEAKEWRGKPRSAAGWPDGSNGAAANR